MDDEEFQYKVTFIDGGEGPKTANWVRRAGKAKVTYASGDTFEGQYNSQGLRHGYGSYQWNTSAMEQFMDVKPAPVMRYQGNYQFGKKHGVGQFFYPNGSKYHGQFMWDKRHGVGSYTYPNGDVYSGNWKGGLRHGKGAYVVKASKCQLVGNWEGGQLTQGNWVTDDGTLYEGKFENSQPSGKGRFTFENGSTQDGEYKSEPVEDDEDAGLKHTWVGAKISKAPTNVFKLSQAPLQLEPDVPVLEQINSFRIINVDPKGVVTLKNAGTKLGNLRGLQVEFFMQGESVPQTSYTFKDVVEVAAQQEVRLLFGSHAALQPKTGRDDDDDDAEMAKPLDIVWTAVDALGGGDWSFVEVNWRDAKGSRQWLARKKADGTHVHKYLSEPTVSKDDDSGEEEDE